MNNLQEIADYLKGSSRILICGHTDPDGDCLGSAAALGMALEMMGKEVFLASPDPLPEMYFFLPGRDKFYIGSGVEDLGFDTFIVLDCSVPDRLGDLTRFLNHGPVVVNIDHHVNSKSFADYNYLDQNAAATGEIMMDLITMLGNGLNNQDIAVCLYVALVTDTGSFKYENTTPLTLKKAARLMEANIQTARINEWLFDEKPLKTVQVMAAALSELKISPCGKVAWLIVKRELLERFSAADEHTEGLVNYLRAIKGVEVAVIFRETENDKIKVGFRSKGLVDVHKLAERLGGGGHMRASGCVLKGSMDQITEMVIKQSLSSVAEKERH